MSLRWILPLLLAAALLLSGCTPLTRATGEFVREVYLPGNSGGDGAQVQLNPALRYLRITLGGRSTLFASGAVDVENGGVVRVWYSGGGEILRIRNGRIVGATGTFTEWSKVDISGAPAWPALARADAAMRWERVRDVMPGYRYGVRDQLSVRPVPPPTGTALVGIDPRQLVWFEETMLSSDAEQLPPSRYAVDLRAGRAIPVYGELCLAPTVTLCFSWQLWPAEPQGGG